MQFKDLEEMNAFFSEDIFGLPDQELNALGLSFKEEGKGWSEFSSTYRITNSDGDLIVIVDDLQTLLSIKSIGLDYIDISLPDTIKANSAKKLVDIVNYKFKTIGDKVLQEV